MTTNLLPAAIRAIVARFPQVIPHLSDDAINFIKAAGYDGIRTVMRGAIFGSVFGYLSGNGSVADFRDRMITAVSRAYVETADVAYAEGGADLPLDDETAAWARAQLDAQIVFIEQLFRDLRELRKQEGLDAGAVANRYADSYSSGLDGYANEARLRGSKNIVAVWHLGEAEEHCTTCASLNGKAHRISWYIERDYIPRKNGAAMDCGGWNCTCTLTDRSGKEITV